MEAIFPEVGGTVIDFWSKMLTGVSATFLLPKEVFTLRVLVNRRESRKGTGFQGFGWAWGIEGVQGHADHGAEAEGRGTVAGAVDKKGADDGGETTSRQPPSNGNPSPYLETPSPVKKIIETLTSRPTLQKDVTLV